VTASAGQFDIRPMGLADILDSSIRLYRRNFGPFLGIVAIAWIPALAIQLYATYWYLRIFMGGQASEVDLLSLAGGGMMLGLASAVVYLVAVPLAQGALIWAISKTYLQQPIGITQAYRVVLDKLGHIILAIVVTGLVVGVGTLACLIPGLVLGFMFAFTIPEVVLGNRDAISAMRRSWELAGYDFWKVVLTLLVLGLLVAIIGGALGAPFQFLTLIPVPQDKMILLYTLIGGIRGLIQVVLQPVQIVGTILLYYDLRIRKEGFDIQLLAEAVDKEGAAVAVQPPPSLLAEDTPPLPPKLDRGHEQ